MVDSGLDLLIQKWRAEKSAFLRLEHLDRG